jgi:hypothetical protein
MTTTLNTSVLLAGRGFLQTCIFYSFSLKFVLHLQDSSQGPFTQAIFAAILVVIFSF